MISKVQSSTYLFILGYVNKDFIETDYFMCMEIPDITMHLKNQDILKFLCELGLRSKEKKNKRRKFREQTSN